MFIKYKAHTTAAAVQMVQLRVCVGKQTDTLLYKSAVKWAGT